jgi:hypothetical protein
MRVNLEPDEVRQAIREWFIRRGVDATKNDIRFGLTTDKHLITEVLGIELETKSPPKEGPYR